MTTQRVETMVREYGSTSDYDKEAKKLAAQGWTVVSVIEKKGGVKWGLVFVLFLLMILPGLLALAFARKTKLVVTYSRALPTMP